MKLTTGILVAGMMTGSVFAQSPDGINHALDFNPALAVLIVGEPQARPAPRPPAANPAKPPAARPTTPPTSAAGPATFSAKPHPTPVEHRLAPRREVIAAPPIAPRTEVRREVPVAVGVAGVGMPQGGNAADASKAKPEEKKWAMSGKRDPFFSPVVQASSGSGCSTGKKCLEIGQINVRGVVKSENGFIAVVTNSLNKAYFLRPNDPVFNGYVVRITGDTVVFQETIQDKLGKPLTREVTKKITTPAV